MRNSNRAYTPEYKRWIAAVKKRDNGQCQYPGCGSKRSLVAHHIRRWADAEELRFDMDNGITLCRKCHKMVTGHELHFAPLFMKILSNPELATKKIDKHTLTVQEMLWRARRGLPDN